MADNETFFTRQHELLNRMEASLDKFKHDVEQSRTEQADAIRARRQKIEAGAHERRQQAEQAENRVKEHVEAKKAETASAVADWKANLKFDLLAMRAEDAESYAVAMEALAEVGIEQAWEAVLAAIEARREAEDAAAAIPSKPV
jgi:hypothetical protein